MPVDLGQILLPNEYRSGQILPNHLEISKKTHTHFCFPQSQDGALFISKKTATCCKGGELIPPDVLWASMLKSLAKHPLSVTSARISSRIQTSVTPFWRELLHISEIT